MKELTYAVIGSGFMGNLLARAASELPYARLIAASDLDVERAKKITTLYGGQAYENYEEMLSNHHPDAVLIATPEYDHLAPTLCAAKAGCHIFLEKPIATTLQDAIQIINCCSQMGVKLMLGHILRFETSYALIYSAIHEGSIGKLLSMYARRIAPINEAKRLQGRVSPLTYIGVHDIDQMLWYHPVEIKCVYARALHGRVSELFDTYDSAWIMIEFEDGALGVHEVGWCLPEGWARGDKPVSWGRFGDVRMNILGSQGSLDLNFTPMNLFGVGSEGWILPDTRHWPIINGKLTGAVKLEMEHFLTCILENKQPLVRGEDGLRVLKIVLAAEESIVNHKIVAINSVNDG